MLTHGLHYGTGVFEGIRCYETERGPAVFRHARPPRPAREVGRALLPGAALLRPRRSAQATHELLRRNGLGSAYIRPLAFRGYGSLGLYAKDAPVDVIIAAFPWGAYLGEESAGRRHPRQGLELAADQPRRLDPARQGLRLLSQLDPRQDRVAQLRLRRGDPARRTRLRLRGLGREHLPGPRRRDRDAAARRLDPRRDQPQVGDPDRPRPRLHRGRARHRPGRALPGRGGLPDRHRRRAGAGARDRRPRDRRARARSPATSRRSSKTRSTGAPRSTWSGSTSSRTRPRSTRRVR